MSDASVIEARQRKTYPGLTVRRDGDAVVVHIPVCFRRRKGSQTLLTPDGQASEPERQANRPLVETLAKAHRWQGQIESGQYAGIDDLAEALGVDRTYAGHMLRLTSLAPDIVEAILRGDESNGVSLRKLQNRLPARWDEQREMWRVGS